MKSTSLPSRDFAPLTDLQVTEMQQYQITFDGGKFRFREYSYDKLQDAINYAKRQPKPEETPSAPTRTPNLPRIKTTVLGGSGWMLKQNDIFVLSIIDKTLNLQPLSPSAENLTIRFSELTAIEVYGPGTQSTNAGVMGGGFGLEGAALGIAAATLINAVTTNATTNTFLRLATREAEVFLHTTILDPAGLRMYLSPAVVRMEASRLEAIRSVATISSEIRALHRLRQEGLLTEEELHAAKMRLWGN